MNKIFSTAAFAIAALLGYGQQTTCVTLQPGPDEGIDAAISNRTDFIDQNYDDYPAYRLHAGTGFDVGSSEQDWRALTKLTYLDELPTGSTIESANIKLFNNTDEFYFESTGENTGSVYLITEDWTESTVTWNTQPAYDMAGMKTVIPEQPEIFDSLELDITSLVKEIVEEGKPNYGFMMRLDNEDPYSSVVFTSSDYSSAKLRPVWEVCYTAPSEDVTIIQIDENSECAYIRPDSLSGVDAAISNRSDFMDQNYDDYPAYRLHAGTGFNVGSTEQDWRALTKLTYLDELPEDIIIDSATVKLTNNRDEDYFETTGDNAGTMYLVTEDWEEGVVTWSTQPAYDMAGTTAMIPGQTSTFDTLELDITGLVKEIVENDKPNYGFLMRLDEETPYRSVVFSSSDHRTMEARPLWEVCYTKIETVTGFLGPQHKTTFTAYPNPTSGYVVLDQPISGVIQTINGNVIEIFSETKELDFTGLKAGLYIIKSDDGSSLKVMVK